ncbi:MAG TPA: hypothetical protein VGT05_03660, partial [Patescibacteria group bacterium]|nr:hypothetical protein [Patescibacteria group bacterium]
SRARFIYPSRNKRLTDIDYLGNDKIAAIFEGGDFGVFDFIIFATGYQQSSLVNTSKLLPVRYERNPKLEIIGKRIFGSAVFFNTLSSMVAASKSELRRLPAIRQFGGEESKNIVSLWRNTPKADALTLDIAATFLLFTPSRQ